MSQFKNDPALAELPEPLTLKPEQLGEVAGGTSALLSAIGHIIICGGFPLGPIWGGMGMASSAM